jgi:hypothetical protein
MGRLRQALPGLGAEAPVAAKIELCGQKWLAPGETLRVIEIESDGHRQKFALWTSRHGGQMLPLEAGTVHRRDKGQFD